MEQKRKERAEDRGATHGGAARGGAARDGAPRDQDGGGGGGEVHERSSPSLSGEGTWTRPNRKLKRKFRKRSVSIFRNIIPSSGSRFELFFPTSGSKIIIGSGSDHWFVKSFAKGLKKVSRRLIPRVA